MTILVITLQILSFLFSLSVLGYVLWLKFVYYPRKLEQLDKQLEEAQQGLQRTQRRVLEEVSDAYN